MGEHRNSSSLWLTLARLRYNAGDLLAARRAVDKAIQFHTGTASGKAFVLRLKATILKSELSESKAFRESVIQI